MYPFERIALLFIITGLLCSTSCSGGESAELTQDASPLPGLTLPAPETLKSSSAVSFFPRFQQGADHLIGGSMQTTPGSSPGQLKFQPDHAGGGTGPAWAIYALDMEAYTGPDEMYMSWEQEPALEDFFYAIANFTTGRWEWYTDASRVNQYPDVDDEHINSTSAMYVVILLTGTAEAELNWVRFGGNVPPVVEFTATPAGGMGSILSTLEVAALDAEGEITLYEFDAFGTGDFVPNGNDPVYPELYDTAGIHTAAVRVRDDDGGVTIATTEIGIGWVRSYGEFEYDSVNAAALDPAGNVLTTGLGNSWSSGFDESSLVGFDSEGSPMLEKVIGTAGFGETGDFIDVNSAGNILLGGSIGDLANADVFLCHLSPAGAINWQKRIGSAGAEYSGNAVLDDMGNAYLAMEYDSGPASSLQLVKFSPAGGIIWQQSITDLVSLTGPQICLDPAGNIYAAAEMQLGAGGNDVIVTMLDNDGMQQWTRQYSTTEDFSLTNIAASASAVHICGVLEQDDIFVIGSMLVTISAAGTLNWQSRMDFGAQQGWQGIAVNPDNGEIVLVGRSLQGIPPDSSVAGMIGRFSSSGEVLQVASFNRDSQSNPFSDVVWAGNGYYITGRSVDNQGDWTVPTYTEYTDTGSLLTVNLPPAPSTIMLTDYTAVAGDISTPAPVLDTGGGTVDMLIVRWFAE